MNIIEEINNDFISVLQHKDYGTEFKKLEETITNLELSYQKKLIPWNLKPLFITEEQNQRFAKLMEIMASVLEKLQCSYFTNKELMTRLSTKGRVSEFYAIDHGYSRNNIVVRGDAFYNPVNESLYFIEFNCGDPSGLAMNDLFVKIFNQFPVLQLLKEKYNIADNKIIDEFHRLLLKKYKEYCNHFGKTESKDPLVAIVCSNNSSIRYDVNFIIEFLKDSGANVQYADPRYFDYDGKTLRLNGEEVHIVYRDNQKDFFRTESCDKWYSNIRNGVLTLTKSACLKNRTMNHFLKRGYFGHAEDILQAFKDGNICLINPFSTYITAKKSILSVMQDKLFCSLFNEEELYTIKNHTPWTRQLKPQKTFYYNKIIDLIDFIKSEREKFVLKPDIAFGGKGVIIGLETNQTDWEKAINAVIKSNSNYIVQEYVDIPTENFPEYENGKLLGFSPKYYNLNLWAFDEKFAGGFLRISDKKIINVARGAGYTPLYYVKSKKSINSLC